MTETPPGSPDLTSQYTAQVTADLERNAKEQERLREEIDALQGQLLRLQQDQTVLANVQKALGTAAPEAASPAGDSAASSLPRQKAGAAPKAGKRTQAKKTAAAESGKQTKAKKPTAKAAAPKKAQPTLVELIRRHLTEQSEPRSAAEVATALGQAHPDRRIQTTVVRTTLEGLVAKSNAQRTRQGSSVYYTAPNTQEPATPPQDSPEPAQTSD